METVENPVGYRRSGEGALLGRRGLAGVVEIAERCLPEPQYHEPEQRLAFHFALDAPAGGWPASDSSLRVLRYGERDAAVQPALAIALDRATLDDRLGLDSG